VSFSSKYKLNLKMANKPRQDRVREIAKQMERGKINPLEASAFIDAALEGITKTVWNPGYGKFKVYNEHLRDEASAGIPTEGRDAKLLAELAALCYFRAQQNGSRTPGEVHVAHGVSSKHYKPGFDVFLAQTLAKYQAAQRSA
jgi:hypothetical protein